MKIINLGRGQGKTTRLLYASEWQDTPILCATYQEKRYLMDMAEKIRREMFPYIRYAGYTPEWENSFEITPASFIVLLNDKAIRPTEKAEVDAGIALMSLTLTAEAEGLASCIIGSVIHIIRMRVSDCDRVLALGPYLSIGVFLSMLWGADWIAWYLTQYI